MNPWSISAQDSESIGLKVATLSQGGWILTDAFLEYEAWRDECGVQIASIRVDLPGHEQIAALERGGFRFIEVMIQPSVRVAGRGWSSGPVKVGPTDRSGTGELLRIAETAFTSDRFSLDSRIPKGSSGRRYMGWVENALKGNGYEIHQITLHGGVAGFFITERVEHSTSHWHLTAIAPELQGMGIGRASWNAMLAMEAERGTAAVTTRISTTNIPAVNLYSSLGFRFSNPQATFHWIRGA